MKAIAYQRYGSPDALALLDLPMPMVSANEVLIKTSYAGVNPIDWKVGEGRLKAYFDPQFPLIVGREISGVVEKIGSGVTQFTPGDAVLAQLPKPGGGFAEFVNVSEDYVARAPARIGAKESASLPLVALTCWQALIDHAQLTAGQTILVLAGAGGTGSLAVQLAGERGAVVLAICGPANQDYVKDLGAHAVFDYTGDAIAAVRRHVPNGVDVVFSNVLGPLHEKSYGVLRKGGVLVTIGEPPLPELAERFGVREVEHIVSPNGEQLAEIVRLVDEGKLRAPAITEMPLAQAAEAFRLSMNGHVRGKIVLSIG